MMTLDKDVLKFRLGVYANQPGDARSLSRLLGPLQLMAKQDPRLELVLPHRTTDNSGWDLDWQWFSQCDAAIMLDPYTEGDVRRAQLARACGCALWVDYVDDLMHVRPSNAVYMSYANRSAVEANIKAIMRQAAAVTCTTETLRLALPDSDRIRVIPESCRWPACDLPRKRVITWRGFGSHNEDLEIVLPQLKELSRLPSFVNWEWAFIGEPLWKIFDGIIPPDKMVFAPPMSPYDLMNRWGGMAPYVHIVPLADNTFNRSKTPLAWLEASAIGAAVLGPNLPEWTKCPGLTRYCNPEDFGQQLRALVESFDNGKLHPAALESRRMIYPAWTTPIVNRKRWEVLAALAHQFVPVGNSLAPEATQRNAEVAA
jgi:hypothetical protein